MQILHGAKICPCSVLRRLSAMEGGNAPGTVAALYTKLFSFFQFQKTIAECCIGIIMDIFPFHLRSTAPNQCPGKRYRREIPDVFASDKAYRQLATSLVKIRTANNKNLFSCHGNSLSACFNIIKNQTAFLSILRVSADNDISATR